MDSREYVEGCAFYALVFVIVTVGIPMLLLFYATLFRIDNGIWPWQ